MTRRAAPRRRSRAPARTTALAAALVLALGGCDPTAPGGVRRTVGIIEWVSGSGTVPGAEFVIDLPDTVTVGIPITATVTTVGPSGCYSDSGAEVTVGPGIAVVTPFDDLTEAEVCTTIFRLLSRPVDITFETTGETRVVVRGLRVEDGDIEGATETEIERAVFVAPQ